VKKIRSDNGSEFKNLQVEEYREEEGIKHEFFAPYMPQQNGVVEEEHDAHRHGKDNAWRVQDSKRFWSEAANTACHAINCLYLHRLLKKTSYELITGNKPNVSYFRVFGSKCYILVKRSRHSKFSPKVVEGFYYVMIQIQRHIGSSTNLWVWLKSLVMLYFMRLMALQESKLILMI
jgi:transposase InsO family protein